MDIEKSKKYALGLLNLRMYSCSEIFERLVRKGAEKEIAEAAVAQLMQIGVLDDRKYAEYYISDAVRLGGKGTYRIRQELIKKGIASAVIDDALESSDTSEEDVFEALLDYARMKFGENTEYSYKEYSKLKARLARRGYSYKEINDCLEALEIRVSRSEKY